MERVVTCPLTTSAMQMREPCLERNVTPLYRVDTIGETPMLVPAAGRARETVVHEPRESLRAALAAIRLGIGRERSIEKDLLERLALVHRRADAVARGQ